MSPLKIQRNHRLGTSVSSFARAVRGLVLSICLGVPSSLALAHSGTVEYIDARDYCGTVQRELGRARSSISVCMYLYVLRANRFESPVFQLTDALVKARDRGVRVEVVLDQNIDFVGGRSPSLAGQNAAAYAFLRAKNIPVFFDEPTTYTHSKAVVIDEETVISGSSNWTDSACNENFETNVLVRSKGLARDVLADLRTIPRAPPSPEMDDPGVGVSVGFLWDEDLFGRMVSTGDERVFDTFLFLAREQVKRSSDTLSLSYEDLVESLGIAAQGTLGARRQINKTLAKLEKKYGLIRAETAYGKDVRVTLGIPAEEPVVWVPSGYWTLGWTRRLSFAGKALYLAGLAEAQASAVSPRWSRSREGLARRYHTSPWFVSQGTVDLRRNNLLEVEYAPFRSDDPLPRHPSFYVANPLYDPAEWDRALDALRTVHGPEKVARAQQAVHLVYEDSDLNAIRTLIELEDQFGQAHIHQALDRIGALAPDNPRRTIAYLIAVIRRM